MDRLSLLAIPAGFILDLLIGDPHWMYHPVRLVGKLIIAAEKGLRRYFPGTERGERAAGTFLIMIVSGITTAAASLLLYGAGCWSRRAAFALEIIMCYQLFAVRALKDESMKVYRELKKPDLEGARRAVSMIVGRDTASLDETGVTKAAVETVAENTSDGIIAPMFYMVIGGPVLGWLYKSINTMDSMVGYKNDKYLNFGRYAAKLDDVVNFIPARISGVLMIAAAAALGVCERLPGMKGTFAWDWKNGARIFKRDRFNHASPNSAQTEAVMAGALNVQLAGDAWYFGKLHKKKTIGDANRAVVPEDIPRANRLLYASSMLGLAVFLLIRWGIMNLMR